jgi:Tol biopolymer transport system component
MFGLLRLSIKSIYSTVITLASLFVIPAHAELRIDITQGSVKPMPIAVADMSGKSAVEKKIWS